MSPGASSPLHMPHMEPPVQHMGEIQRHSDNTGFWGVRTASVDWCEPNYTWSPYIAEWWNTWTSVCIVACGVLGCINAIRYKYAWRFFIPSAWMAGVGLGSIAFHGTLKYWGQALDELSMVYAVTGFLFIVFEMEDNIRRWWLPYAIVAYDLLFTVVYATAPRYFDIFVAIFIAGCVWLLWQSIRIYKVTYDIRLRRLFWVGFGIYAAAFFLMWIPDNLACERVGWLHLHAWFHICSSIAPYWWITWATHSFYSRRYAERTGKLRMSDGSERDAPKELMDVLAINMLPADQEAFAAEAAKEMHALAPAWSDWAAERGLPSPSAAAKAAHAADREREVKEKAMKGSPLRPQGAGGSGRGSEAGTSRPSSPVRDSRDSTAGRRSSVNSDASGASDPAASRAEEDVSASGSRASRGAGGADADVTAGAPGASASGAAGSARGRPGPLDTSSSASALSGHPPQAQPGHPLIHSDAPIPVPTLDWFGPRSLVIIPYVELEWKKPEHRRE